jgi:hypothetical protein
MKLNPEELEVVSFDTELDRSTDHQITVDTNLPTPQTYCFVCD